MLILHSNHVLKLKNKNKGSQEWVNSKYCCIVIYNGSRGLAYLDVPRV